MKNEAVSPSKVILPVDFCLYLIALSCAIQLLLGGCGPVVTVPGFMVQAWKREVNDHSFGILINLLPRDPTKSFQCITR